METGGNKMGTNRLPTITNGIASAKLSRIAVMWLLRVRTFASGASRCSMMSTATFIN